MAKRTQKEMLESGLKACGWKVDPNARTSKYTVYVRENDEVKYLVGRSGGLRRTKSAVTKSTSLTGGKFHQALKKIGERAEEFSSPEDAFEELKILLSSNG